MNDAHLQRLVDYWQTLTPESVAAIAAIYTEDATFRDPFNDVRGIAAIRHVFADMFVRVREPRFTIVEVLRQEGGAMLIWDFEYVFLSHNRTKLQRIHGASHIRFAADGRVRYHHDYWDAAGELYSQFPLVGPLMRWLAKRLGSRVENMRR